MLELIGTVELLLLVEVMEVLVPVGVKVLRLLEVRVLRSLEVKALRSLEVKVLRSLEVKVLRSLEVKVLESLEVKVLRLLEVRGVEELVGMERLSVSVGMGRVSVELLVVSTDGVASGSPNQPDKQSRWGWFGIELTSNA